MFLNCLLRITDQLNNHLKIHHTAEYFVTSGPESALESTFQNTLQPTDMAASDYSFHTYTVTHTYTVAITGFLITYLFDIMHKHQRLFKDSPYTHSVQSNTQFPECLTRLVISVRVFLVLIFAMFIVFEFTLLFCIVIFALLLHCFTFVVCRSHDLWPVLDSEY